MLMKGHKPRKVDTIMKVTLFLCASLDGFIRPLQFRIFIRRVGVRYVPKAEVDLGTLNVRYRESGPSDFIAQRLLCARSRLQRFQTRVLSIFLASGSAYTFCSRYLINLFSINLKSFCRLALFVSLILLIDVMATTVFSAGNIIMY